MREDEFKLPDHAYNSLIKVLEKDIGKEAVSQLSRKDVNEMAHWLLTLTAIQLKIRIRKRKRELARQNVEK